MVFHVEQRGSPYLRVSRETIRLTTTIWSTTFGRDGHATTLVHMTELTAASPALGRIVAVANQKGGVGKTTTAINLATSIALSGRRVLLVDVDPQGNLTSGVGSKGERTAAGTVYDALLTDGSPDDFVLRTKIENLWLMPADRNLTGAEIEMVALPEREHRLKRVLDPLRAQYEYLFVDCPPSLGL